MSSATEITNFSLQLAQVLDSLSHTLSFGFYGDCANLLLGDLFPKGTFNTEYISVHVKGDLPAGPSSMPMEACFVKASLLTCLLQVEPNFSNETLHNSLEAHFPEAWWWHNTNNKGFPLSSTCEINGTRYIKIAWNSMKPSSSSPPIIQIHCKNIKVPFLKPTVMYRSRVMALTNASVLHPAEADRLWFLEKRFNITDVLDQDKDVMDKLVAFAAALQYIGHYSTELRKVEILITKMKRAAPDYHSDYNNALNRVFSWKRMT